MVLPIYFHLKDIHLEKGITLKEIFDSISNLITDQAVYDLIFG